MRFAGQSSKLALIFKPRRSFPLIRASSGFSSSLDTGIFSFSLFIHMHVTFLFSFLGFSVFSSIECIDFKLVLLMRLGLSTELDAVASYSEIVPDTVIFDDFERFHFRSFFFFWFTNVDTGLGSSK